MLTEAREARIRELVGKAWASGRYDDIDDALRTAASECRRRAMEEISDDLHKHGHTLAAARVDAARSAPADGGD